MAARDRTLSVEAPGIAGSELPEGEFSLFDFADDIQAVINLDIAEALA